MRIHEQDSLEGIYVTDWQGVIIMPTILVDYENVNGSNGLKGTDVLCRDDTLIIFYSKNCGKIRYDYMQEIKESGCEFRVIKLKGTGKNALDFYIAAECGIISERGENEIAIISNDKGFQAVIDFFGADQNANQIQIVKAGNIRKCTYIISMHPEVQREEKKNTEIEKLLLDLSAESARIEESNKNKKEIENILMEQI